MRANRITLPSQEMSQEKGFNRLSLKILEGTVANIPEQGGRKHPQQQFIQLDTSNILFILGGAFEGIEEIMKSKMSPNGYNLGFGKKTESATLDYTGIVPQDLLKYGFIPEFIGRLPLIVGLADLTQAELRQVLIEPKNSLVKQYKALFQMDNVSLEFEPDALDACAKLAAERGPERVVCVLSWRQSYLTLCTKYLR